MNRFFIKEGIFDNPVRSHDLLSGEKFWTEKRLKKSLIYQYHVYELAAKLFEQRKFKSLIDIGSGPGTKTKLFFEERAASITLVDQESSAKIAEQVLPKATFKATDLEMPDLQGT
ncbi:MAG: hypothetical protein JJ936_14040, partial [Psychroserpens sp.]|nr:hypothetical protein [Psychroserpens sp.]